MESAYFTILDLERASDGANFVKARVLGYFLREGPTELAVSGVAKEIATADNDQALYVLVDMYINHFIFVCEHCFPLYFRHFNALVPCGLGVSTVRTVGGRTPASSTHPSRPSFDVERGRIHDLLNICKATPLITQNAKYVVSVVFHAALAFSNLSPKDS